MLKFLKNIFSKKNNSFDEEYLDFSDYTDVSIDLKKVHKNENYSKLLRENQEKSIAPAPKDIAPPLPELKKEVEEKLIIPSEKKINTEIDTQKVNDIFNVQEKRKTYEEVAVEKHKEKIEKTSRGIVSSIESDDKTYSKDFGTVQFELQKKKSNENRKPVLLMIALLMGVLIFLSLGSKNENEENVVEEEKVLTDLELENEEEIRVEQKVDFLASGAGLAYNCEKQHWACLNKENFMKCRELSSKKKCFGVKVYKSKSICQKVQQKSIDLNRRIKSCR